MDSNVISGPARERLPAERKAITHRFSVDGHEGYLTVGMYADGRPGEIFIRIAKEGSTLSGTLDAFAVAISLELQHGVPLRQLVEKFCNVRYEPFGRTSNDCILSATSITDYVFRWLALKFLSLEEMEAAGVLTKCHECSKAVACGDKRFPCIAVRLTKVA